jgi:hypothetical protein
MSDAEIISMGDHERRRPQADPPAPSADDLADGLADAARETFGESAWEQRLGELQQVLRRRLAGDYVVDDFGFDAELTEQFLLTALRPLAEKWFRIEVYGVDNIPREGGALIVSNHSGTIPLDCLMTGLVTHDRAGRFLRMLGADLLFRLPFVGALARKGGVTLASAVTPLFPWFGPFGLVPLPSKWLIEFGEPVTPDVDADEADDPMVVFDVTDHVRETIQQTLYSLLDRRGSAFS